MKDRKKYFCSAKGCTRQVYKQGLCNAHLKEKEASIAISEKSVTSNNKSIKDIAVEDVKKVAECKCKSHIKLLINECVINLHEWGGGYGVVKIYHRNNLLYSAIGLIKRIEREREN